MRNRRKKHTRARRAHLVDAGPTRDTIRGLLADGWSLNAVARQAATSHQTLWFVLHRQDRCSASLADRVAAVARRGPDPADALLVPVGESRRRLRSLARNGWTSTELAARTGVSRHTHDLVVNGGKKWVRPAYADRVRAVWVELWDTPGPSKAAAAHAARKGWPMPIDWDTDPTTPGPGDDVLDPVEVERAVAVARWDRVPGRLPADVARAAAAVLLAEGHAPTKVADNLRTSTKALAKAGVVV